MIYALVITIGGVTMSDSCSKTLCYEDLETCQRMAIRLSFRQTDPEIHAYCKTKRIHV